MSEFGINEATKPTAPQQNDSPVLKQTFFQRVWAYILNRYIQQNMDFADPADEAAFREEYIQSMRQHTGISMLMIAGFFAILSVMELQNARKLGWPRWVLIVREGAAVGGICGSSVILILYVFRRLKHCRSKALPFLLLYWYFYGIVFYPVMDLLFALGRLGITTTTPMITPTDIIYSLPYVVVTSCSICCGFATFPLPLRYMFWTSTALVATQVVLFLALAPHESANYFYAASIVSTFTMIRTGREMAFDREIVMRRMWREGLLRGPWDEATLVEKTNKLSGRGWKLRDKGLMAHIVPSFTELWIEMQFQHYRWKQFATSYVAECVGNVIATDLTGILMYRDDDHHLISGISRQDLQLMMYTTSTIVCVTLPTLYLLRSHPRMVQIAIFTATLLISLLHMYIFHNSTNPQPTSGSGGPGMTLNYIVTTMATLTSPLISTPVSTTFIAVTSPLYLTAVMWKYEKSKDVRALLDLVIVLAGGGLPVYTHDLEFGLRRYYANVAARGKGNVQRSKVDMISEAVSAIADKEARDLDNSEKGDSSTDEYDSDL